jgi:hypothetical protein
MYRGEDQQQQYPGSYGREDEGILGWGLKRKSEVIRHGSEKRGN